MIRNMVFDMGRVLLSYDPVAVCRQITQREEDIEILRKELFGSGEWQLLDEGTITEAEAMEQVKKRLPDERLRELADWSMAHWHEYNLRPVPGMAELVKELKEKGYHIYLCSNMSLRLRVFQEEIPGSRYFDGMLVSAEEKLLKPSAAIYQRLFEKFGIRPEESFFIDDLPANIEGAARCGMEGYCFRDENVEMLRRELKKRGIL